MFIFLSSEINAQSISADSEEKISKELQLANKNETLGDYKEATRSINEVALLYWEAKDYQRAIRYFLQSIELNQKINNKSGISKLESNLGMIYSDMKEYETSLDYFNKSLKYREQFGENTERISTRINMAVVLNNLQRYQEAANNLEIALEMATEMNDAAQMKSCYGMLAETYEKAGNQELTIKYFNLYRTFHEMIQKNKVEQAKKEVETERSKALKLELEKREQEIELLKAKEELDEAEKELAGLDERTKDLIRNNSKQELAIGLLENEVELEKSKAVRIQEEKQRQILYTWLVALGFVMVFLLALILYRNYLHKRRVSELLSEQNEEIRLINETLELQVRKRTADLQEAFDKLKERNSNLNQFSNIISHNLRGPVASMLGLANLLNRDDPSDPVNKEVFERLVSSAKTLDDIVGDLSDILEVRDQENLKYEDVDLNEVLEKSSKLALNGAGIDKVELKSNFLGGSTIRTVKPYVESIFYNLISNSLKYKQPNLKPVINITTDTQNGKVKISVTDNGKGIHKSYWDKIFEPYQKLEVGYQGKGLGLYLVKTHVQSLNGTISVSSEEKKGTTFTIELPKTNLNAEQNES